MPHQPDFTPHLPRLLSAGAKAVIIVHAMYIRLRLTAITTTHPNVASIKTGMEFGFAQTTSAADSRRYLYNCKSDIIMKKLSYTLVFSLAMLAGVGVSTYQSATAATPSCRNTACAGYLQPYGPGFCKLKPGSNCTLGGNNGEECDEVECGE